MKKTVLITGANSGIGLAATKEFLNQGDRVLATVRNESRKAELRESIPQENLSIHCCELSNLEEIQSLFENLEPIDVLVNNAGIYQQTHWLKASKEDFETMFNVNTRSTFFLCQQAIQHFQKGDREGLILNNSSTLGVKPAPNTSLYSASKAAVISLSKSLAMEFAPKIRSNCILPGVVKTPIHSRVMGEENAMRFQEEIVKMHPLGRIGTAEELAKLIYSLTTDSFAWMTGTEIVIDGGISLVC